MTKRITALLLAVLLVTTALFSSACSKTPKGQKGFFDTKSNIGAWLDDAVYIPTPKKDDNAKISLDLALTKAPSALEIDEFLPVKVSAEILREGKKMSAGVSLDALGEQISASLYTDGEKAYLSLPELLSRCVCLDTEAAETDVSGAFKALTSLLENAERYKTILMNTIPEDRFRDGKDAIEIDGKAVNVPATTLILDRSDLEEVIRALAEEAKKDDALRALILPFEDSSEGEYTEKFDAALAEILEGLDEKSELVWTRIYYKGVSVAEYIRLTNEEGDVVINYAYYDGKKVGEGKFSVKYYPADEEEEPGFDGFLIDYRADKDGDGVTGKLTLRAGDDVILIVDTQKDGDKIGFTVTVPENGYADETVSAVLTGTAEKKGDEKTAFAFDGELTVGGMVFGFSGSGEVEISDDIRVTAPDTENAYDMSDSQDAMQVVSELFSGVMTKYPQLSGVLSGILGGGEPETDWDFGTDEDWDFGTDEDWDFGTDEDWDLEWDDGCGMPDPWDEN